MSIVHKKHYCEECDATSDEIDILLNSYGNLWRCVTCIESCRRLAGSKWEHPREFEESYSDERKQARSLKRKRDDKTTAEEFAQKLREFATSADKKLSFDNYLSKRQRPILRTAAKKAGLKFLIHGEGMDQRVTIEKK